MLYTNLVTIDQQPYDGKNVSNKNVPELKLIWVKIRVKVGIMVRVRLYGKGYGWGLVITLIVRLGR